MRHYTTAALVAGTLLCGTKSDRVLPGEPRTFSLRVGYRFGGASQ